MLNPIISSTTMLCCHKPCNDNNALLTSNNQCSAVVTDAYVLSHETGAAF